jgi:very-short-patch-repair endonuclease
MLKFIHALPHQGGGQRDYRPMPKHQVTDLQRTRSRQLRRDLTEPEQKLWHLLRSRRLAHVKFRRQAPIGPWIADFVSHEFKLIIEADGSQHADSPRDTQRDTDLAQRGYRVLRFWNNDIMQNTEGVLERILEAVEEPSSSRRSRR